MLFRSCQRLGLSDCFRSLSLAHARWSPPFGRFLPPWVEIPWRLPSPRESSLVPIPLISDPTWTAKRTVAMPTIPAIPSQVFLTTPRSGSMLHFGCVRQGGFGAGDPAHAIDEPNRTPLGGSRVRGPSRRNLSDGCAAPDAPADKFFPKSAPIAMPVPRLRMKSLHGLN